MKGSFRQFVSQNAKLKTWSVLILFVSLLCIGGIFTVKQIKSLKDLHQSLTEELQRVQKTRDSYLQEISIVRVSFIVLFHDTVLYKCIDTDS